MLITDITGVRGRAARLAVSEQRLRSIMDNVVEGILTTDANGRIESANRVIETMLGHGLSDLVGQGVSVVLPAAADADFLASRLTPAKGRRDTELIARTMAGAQLPVEINVGEMRIEGERKFIVMLRDIRERKAQQAQLTQSSKLASLGEIATGLAHELNQPLNIIRMAADSSLILMADGMADADFQRSQFGFISGQTVRMAKIIEHMRVFGRKDNADAVAFNPVDSARSALSLVQQQLRVADIDLEVDLPGECRMVQGYPLRLEQVLLNLINNARDAVQSQPGRSRSRSRIGLRIVDDPTIGEVLIEIADNGGGIPAEMLDRVFDPFFTTKEAGKGTGLGLSISYAIIGDMGGRLAVRNGPDGAIFSIALPAQPEFEKGQSASPPRNQ